MSTGVTQAPITPTGGVAAYTSRQHIANTLPGARTHRHVARSRSVIHTTRPAVPVRRAASSSSHRTAASRRCSLTVTGSSSNGATPPAEAQSAAGGSGGEATKVIIAGGGIGGLAFANACHKKGLEVEVYEKVKEYKPFGGPIQLQGNALGMLEAIDPALAARIMAAGTVHGDRLNGLLDGRSGEWYMRFDTRSPHRIFGLPLTIVISRFKLLDLLTEALPEGVVKRGRGVMSYEDKGEGKGVVAVLEDGTRVQGDVLVGSDGIKSRVRHQMKGSNFLSNPVYSGYTCYTGTCQFTPRQKYPVGYQVFLGNLQYFVASQIGEGQTQWYAFIARPAGEPVEPDGVAMKKSLMQAFEGWCPDVVDCVGSTGAGGLERRDVFDHIPALQWARGRVALLGDAAHAMQPNLGQGGCQAIEDAYVLAAELAGARAEGRAIQGALGWYQGKRVLRCGAVMGLARLSALLTTTYRGKLGESAYAWYPPEIRQFWKKVEGLGLPHPGAVFGQILMLLSMDVILLFLIGGGQPDIEDRAPYCQIPGKSEVPTSDIPEEEFRMKGLPGFAN